MQGMWHELQTQTKDEPEPLSLRTLQRKAAVTRANDVKSQRRLAFLRVF
ncbi:hypothetical protein EMIT07CA2_170019 [Brevibacillus sp. IT-7CA2]